MPDQKYSLREKCRYSEFFWSVFSFIRTECKPENFEYRYLLRIYYLVFHKDQCWQFNIFLGELFLEIKYKNVTVYAGNDLSFLVDDDFDRPEIPFLGKF